MQSHVIDILKDIITKVNNYFNIHKYQVTVTDTIMVEYEYRGWFYLNNFVNAYNNELTRKIYKYQDIYWEFSGIKDLNSKYIDDITHIYFTIDVLSSRQLSSYLNILPRELVDIISSYLNLTEINSFCVYMKTWEDYCNENLYQMLYSANFPQFYGILRPFLKYDVSNNWRDRYTKLLWEETPSLSDLARRYQRINPRLSHISFLLDLYNFYNSDKLNIVIKLWQINPGLVIDLFSYATPDRKNKILNFLLGMGRHDIVGKLNG